MRNMNGGYFGYSMSNNAVAAYESGEKPLSKWTKSAIFESIAENSENYTFKKEILEALKKMPVKALKSLVLEKTSWHHTSSYCNATDFYSVDFDAVVAITVDQIEKAIAEGKTEKKAENAEELWECKFLEWSGTRNHPKATEYIEIGEIRGNWFFRKNGSKKSINANGFEKLRKVG